MRYVNLLFAAVFTWSAAIQYNAPDPWLWIAVYLGAAVIAFMASFRRFYLPAIMALGLICVIWILLATRFFMAIEGWSFVDGLYFHRSLICFDFSDNIARLNGVTFLDIPLSKCSFCHCRR